MRRLPLPDPGVADHRSAGRFLWWLVVRQRRGMTGAVLTGIVAMLSQAVTPAVIGVAIDRGVAAKDTRELVLLCALMFAIGVVGSLSGIMRHRFNVANWLDAAYRVVQLVTRQAVDLGATLPKRVATGEVVAIGNNDLSHLGNAMEITGRAAGAAVSFVVVALLLLHTSMT